MTTGKLQSDAWANKLHSSVDGRGLKDASLVPKVHGWVSSGNCLMSGAKFIGALGVRAGIGRAATTLRSIETQPFDWMICLVS